MKRSEIFFSALLVPVDFFALLLAFVVSYRVRDEFVVATPEGVSNLANRFQYNPLADLKPIEAYFHYLPVIIPAMLLIFAFVGLYSMRSDVGWIKRFMHIFIGVTGGEFFILLLFLLKRDFFLPRAMVLYSWVLATLFVLLGRLIVRAIQKVLYAYGIGAIRIGVVGKGSAAKHLAEKIGDGPMSTYRVVFRCDSLSLEELLQKIDKEIIDELVVVSQDYNNDELVKLRNQCLERHIGFSFVPPLLTVLSSSTFDIQPIAGLPMIEIRPTPLEGWGRVVKRIFDIIVTSVMTVVLSPVFLLVIIVMKLTDPGPLVFRHRRIGRNGQTIYVTKFRSMRVGWGDVKGKLSPAFQNYLDEHPEAAEEWKETQKLKDDPRISRIGKILRKTRLDELPQLIDVLIGSLSLVGPRPIIESEVHRFGEKARILFTVRPGVFGPWQVEGGNDLPYEQRVALNSYYIEHWSLWLDLSILFKSGMLVLGELFKSKGGY